MKRKRKTKSDKDAKPKQALPKEESAQHTKEEESNPMDFGGLPARDLKKNLGCG